MFRLALRSVAARWGRLVLTSLAIIASTAFLSGTFIFRDTIERTFDALFANVYERVDAYVQSSNSVENLFGLETRDRLPDSIVDDVKAVLTLTHPNGDRHTETWTIEDAKKAGL